MWYAITMSDAVQTPGTLPEGFVRPSHGIGMLRAPWKKGERPPVGKTTIDRYQTCQKLCRERSPAAADEMYRLMTKDEDSRIRFMAASWIYERAWGKPTEYDPRQAPDDAARIDVANLTREELDILLAITRRGAVQQPSPEPPSEPPAVIEGVVTDVSTPRKRRK